MKQYSNCEISPSNVTLKLINGITEYEIYGFVEKRIVDNIEMIFLQPADLRKKPVIKVPTIYVDFIKAKF